MAKVIKTSKGKKGKNNQNPKDNFLLIHKKSFPFPKAEPLTLAEVLKTEAKDFHLAVHAIAGENITDFEKLSTLEKKERIVIAARNSGIDIQIGYPIEESVIKMLPEILPAIQKSLSEMAL